MKSKHARFGAASRDSTAGLYPDRSPARRVALRGSSACARIDAERWSPQLSTSRSPAPDTPSDLNARDLQTCAAAGGPAPQTDSAPARAAPDAKLWPLYSDGTLAADLPCIGCQYNLRGIRPDARCPECGLSRPAARGSGVLGRRGLWMLAAMLLVVYVVVLLIVAAAK